MNRTRLFVFTAALAVTIIASSVYAAGKININTASKRGLKKLPGVGEDIAELIIKYRRENGAFSSISELKQIPGIGDRRLDALEDTATVGKTLRNSS